MLGYMLERQIEVQLLQYMYIHFLVLNDMRLPSNNRNKQCSIAPGIEVTYGYALSIRSVT